MKIQLINSPFDFDEVGEKTAQRWFLQGRGVFTPDGKTLILHTRNAWKAIVRSEEHDPVSGNFEWFVGESGGSKLMREYEGISGGTRLYQAVHGDNAKP